MHKPLARPRMAVLGLAILAVLAYISAATAVTSAAGASLSFTNCSASIVNYSFTVSGAGFTPGAQYEVTVQDNVFTNPGPAIDPTTTQPFFPTADANGSFSVAVSTGSSQVLPATVYVYDTAGNLITSAQLTPSMLGSGCPLAGGGGGGTGPTTADQCKKDAWMAWPAPFAFKNQGDCVSYLEHLKK